MTDALPSPEPVLETGRLILRVPGRADFEPWAAALSNPDVMRYLGGVKARPLAWRHFVASVGAWHVQGFNAFSVIEKASGRWIGRIGPLYPEGWPGTEIGWTLAAEAWGRGYATEAAIAATDWSFENLGWTEIIHCIAPDNRASQAVAARLGSRRRGPGRLPAPHENESIELWGQTREEWYARRGEQSA